METILPTGAVVVIAAFRSRRARQRMAGARLALLLGREVVVRVSRRGLFLKHIVDAEAGSCAGNNALQYS